MGRFIGNQVNELRLHDAISNSDILLKYRMPTTAEREGYANESVRRIRNKVKYSIVAAREKYGAKILMGFRDGDFEIDQNGAVVPIASDPASPNYRDNWKELVVEHASDLVQTLAYHVFDSPSEVVEDGGSDLEKN